MIYRSWLVVPAHSEKRLAKAIGVGADAVVIDLVESDPLASRAAAQRNAAEWLQSHGNQAEVARWVRINPLDNGAEWRHDLLAILRARPDGIVLPRAAQPEAVRQLAAEIYELEQREQIPANSTRIIPMLGDTAQAALTTPQYIQSGHQRISGFGWGTGELAAAIGATRTHDETGAMTDTFRWIRSQVLLTAHACGHPALDSAPAALFDDSDFATTAVRACADGFSGMFAYHPEQVEAINAAFTPSDDELKAARAILEAAGTNPTGAPISYQGRTLAMSEVKLAQRTLGLEGQAPADQQYDKPILRPA